MLGTWTLVSTCKYESTCSFVKYKFYYQDVINFAVFSTFFRKWGFLAKVVPTPKGIVWQLCYRFV